MTRLLLALYSVVLFALVPLALFHLWWRGRRQPAYRRHIGERFGHYRVRGTTPLLWIHAVSVGETRAAQPLIEALGTRYPGHRILLTHTTPTGRETGKSLFGDRVIQAYLPYDLPFAVEAFLAHFRPALGVLMETELWPNLLRAARARDIPVFLANARMSEKSARGYRRVRPLASVALGCLAGIAAQTRTDAERLGRLGAQRMTVTGNMKFDIVPPAGAQELARALRARFGTDRPVFLAASTREGEEALLLPLLDRLLPPETLLVVVPRHPQRFDDVAELLRSARTPFVRRSSGEPVPASIRVVLGDSMGEMFGYYGAADLAYVGGSLLPLGGQNLIEACAMGLPVLVGPYTFNFSEATALARDAGAAIQVQDVQALFAEASRLLADREARARMSEAARSFATTHRGATERVVSLLVPSLPRSR